VQKKEQERKERKRRVKRKQNCPVHINEIEGYMHCKKRRGGKYFEEKTGGKEMLHKERQTQLGGFFW